MTPEQLEYLEKNAPDEWFDDMINNMTLPQKLELLRVKKQLEAIRTGRALPLEEEKRGDKK